jgi:hypothetical protein
MKERKATLVQRIERIRTLAEVSQQTCSADHVGGPCAVCVATQNAWDKLHSPATIYEMVNIISEQGDVIKACVKYFNAIEEVLEQTK